ncbi:vacuolar-processing enzyme-like [Rutidosis leptorrhynchoides]|uniref:vacuolar-processing enzyme-like n=1 Tax=Rutidosis leptorrhynchoides TaxID=125765 RepID=UPI003A98CF73
MYDDIADNPSNPQPGVVINSPKGSDVYAGVPKDYTGESVTASNLFAVLLGNETRVKGGSKKVIKSKPNDKIFLFYSDHGGPGVLGMPNPPYSLFADQFIKVLKTMHASGTYDEMVIYLESCDSGSIFQGLLPKNLNIYVTTAANEKQLSWATYCPDDDETLPKGYDTCLGDLYSVSWMEDSDSHDLTHETLEQQYLKVKKRTLNKNQPTAGSNVMQYGTMRINKETVSVYQGSNTQNLSVDPLQSFGPVSNVDQRDADLYSMWREYNSSKQSSQKKEELLKKIKDITTHRAHLDSSVDMIKRDLLIGSGLVRGEGSALVDDWDCLRSMVHTFETYCGSLTQYGMKHTRTFADLCNNGVTIIAMDGSTQKACSSHSMGKWNPVMFGYSA